MNIIIQRKGLPLPFLHNVKQLTKLTCMTFARSIFAPNVSHKTNNSIYNCLQDSECVVEMDDFCLLTLITLLNYIISLNKKTNTARVFCKIILHFSSCKQKK